MLERCNICPRLCNVLRSDLQKGFCQVPNELIISRASLHHWEEPVISGTRGSGTVFFTGCNLRCVFCQNYDISSQLNGIPISVDRLREIYDELIALGAHNINLVSPTHYSRAILASLDKKLPVPIIWNTNGYDSVETLKKLKGKIDIFLPDMKYMDNQIAIKYSGAKDYVEVAIAAIDEMVAQTGPLEFGEDGLLKRGVIIRHLIMPGMVSNTEKVIRYVDEHFPKGMVGFSLMRQYIPCGKVSENMYSEINRKVSFKEYKRAQTALFNSNIEYGYLQDGTAASKEFIPAFDGTGVVKK